MWCVWVLFANCLQIILFAIWSLCGHNCIEWPLLAYVIYLCLLELVEFLYAMVHRECERFRGEKYVMHKAVQFEGSSYKSKSIYFHKKIKLIFLLKWIKKPNDYFHNQFSKWINHHFKESTSRGMWEFNTWIESKYFKGNTLKINRDFLKTRSFEKESEFGNLEILN